MKSHLFATTYQEHAVSGGFGLQNERLLKITLEHDVLARQGAAVAWQGDVSFAFEGAGAKRLVKKLVTGEDLQLMRVTGQGDAFFANYADEVHIVELEGESITVNGANVLAFSASLDWDVKRVKGFGGMYAQGLANIEISGKGSVALTTAGSPVVLDPSTQPTFTDPAAVVAWSSNLAPSVTKTDGIMKSMIGRGSGELFSLGFNGPGFVIVQPSEGYPWSTQASASSPTTGIGSLFNN